MSMSLYRNLISGRLSNRLRGLSVLAIATGVGLACSKTSSSQPTSATQQTSVTQPTSASQPTSQTARANSATAERKVYFVQPADGATLQSPITVQFGVSGMRVVPAGEALLDKSAGHHHLIIDGKPIPQGELVPMNDTHIHYGKGQTEAKVALSPGKHTLTMQFADGAHISYGPEMSATITVNVQ